MFRVPCSVFQSGQAATTRGFDVLDQKIHQALVEVIPTQPRIAVRRQHLEHAMVQLQYGEVKSASAQIIDCDLRLLFELIQTVGQGRRRRFIDDAFHGEPGQLARPFGSVPLSIVEIGRHGDHRPRHRLAKICFGVSL